MPDEKTVDLRIDASQGAQALNQVETAAEGAADAMGELAVAVERTENNVKKITTASRDYQSAARSVGDSVQSITRFEAAYRASLNDTANSAQVRAQILSASFSRTIGGAADEARAVSLLSAGHKDAAAAVRFMLDNHATLPPALNNGATGFRNFGMVAQQAGYQISDVAAVAAAGGNVMATVGTQLGQFLGVFGPMGAIVGAAVTVLGLLATNILKVGESSEAATKAEKSLADALQSANELTKTSIELARLKASAARDAAAATLAEQQAIANKEFMEQGQKVAGLRERDGKKSPGYESTELADAEAGLEKIYRRLIDISDAKAALNKAPPQRLADSVLTADRPKAELEAKRSDLQSGIDQAKAAGDISSLARLTEAYGAVNRAIATYKTEGEKAVLIAEAQAKASGMGAAEGARYLAQRQAEINLMGKVVEQGEVEKTLAAARIEANTAAEKSYRDMAKARSEGEIDTSAKLALAGLDAERQALAQRRQLGEITAADELAQAIDIGDKKRQVEEQQARAKLALLRRSAGVERNQIDAAERAITELQAKHSLDRQKQIDEEAAHRQSVAKQMAALEAEGIAARGNAGVSAKTENVGFQKSMGRIDGSEEIAALRQIADEKYQIELDLLNKKLQLAGVEESERARINQQILALDEKRAADMMRLDHQASLNRLQEIRSVTAPFTQATNIMTQGFIQGTLTRQQIASRAAQSIAVSYLNMGTKVATDWLHTHVVMAAWDKLFGAEKVATAAATEAAKTGATTAGEASRTAATATGETAQVAAVSAGEAAKVGAKGAGAAAGLGMQATADSSSIMMSAWTAMAGAYASISAIPYVGPFLAPVVAAGAFAAVAALAKSVFSAEGGWGEVPEDGMQTILHKKEMVLPAQFAVPLRAMLTGGGVPGMPALSGPQAVNSNAMPRYGLPSFLGRDLGRDTAKSVQSISNSNHAGNTTHVHVNATVNGRLSTADIQNFREEVCREFQNGARNGNPHALAALRSGKK